MFLSIYVQGEVRNSAAVPLLTVYWLVRKKRNRGSRNNLKNWRVFVLISYFNLSFFFSFFFSSVVNERNRGSWNNLNIGEYLFSFLISISHSLFSFFSLVAEEKKNRGSWNNLWKWKICRLWAGISNSRQFRRKKHLPQSWYTYAVNWLMICSDRIFFSRKIS